MILLVQDISLVIYFLNNTEGFDERSQVIQRGGCLLYSGRWLHSGNDDSHA